MGIEISFVDLAELSKLKSAIKPNTKVNFVFLWNWTGSDPGVGFSAYIHPLFRAANQKIISSKIHWQVAGLLKMLCKAPWAKEGIFTFCWLGSFWEWAKHVQRFSRVVECLYWLFSLLWQMQYHILLSPNPLKACRHALQLHHWP